MAEVWGNAGAGSALRHDAVYTPSSHKLGKGGTGRKGLAQGYLQAQRRLSGWLPVRRWEQAQTSPEAGTRGLAVREGAGGGGNLHLGEATVHPAK